MKFFIFCVSVFFVCFAGADQIESAPLDPEIMERIEAVVRANRANCGHSQQCVWQNQCIGANHCLNGCCQWTGSVCIGDTQCFPGKCVNGKCEGM